MKQVMLFALSLLVFASCTTESVETPVEADLKIDSSRQLVAVHCGGLDSQGNYAYAYYSEDTGQYVAVNQCSVCPGGTSTTTYSTQAQVDAHFCANLTPMR